MEPKRTRRKMKVPNYDYNKYLQSRKWRELRKQRIEKDHGQCAICGSTKNLLVHHTTYENYKNENLDELLTLCKTCHYRMHNPLKDYFNSKSNIYVQIYTNEYIHFGQIVPVGEPESLESLLSTKDYVTDSKYHLITLSMMCDVLDALGSETGKIFSHILKNMDENNVFDIYHRDISKELGVKPASVGEAVRVLQEKDAIAFFEDGLIVNPWLVHKGDSTREVAIFKNYEDAKRP